MLDNQREREENRDRKMRFIESLRSKYRGKEIWILGSGPSLDDFPDNFFEEKIFIEINWIFSAFPPLSESNYILTTHIEPPKYLMEHKPEFLKKSILGLPLLTGKTRGNADLLGECKDDPIYFQWHWVQGRKKLFFKHFAPTIRSIIKGESCKYICFRTNVHYAIQIAVILGAKTITLVGCEAKRRKGKTRAAKRGLAFHYKTQGKGKGEGMEFEPDKWQLGTALLAKALKSHGIGVRKYYYGKGYEAIN